MLNSILKTLNGHGTEAESLQAALVQLGRDRDTVRAELVGLNDRRRQLLLDDASDADLDKVERLIDRATVRLEKLNLAEAPLQDRIAAARTTEQAAALARHRERRLAMYVKLRAAVEAAAEVQRQAMNADDAACSELGEHVARAHLQPVAFRGMLRPEHVRLWTDEMDRVFAAPQPIPAPIAQRPATPHPAAPRRQVQAAAPPVRAKPLPDEVRPLAAGEIRVLVLRKGYEGPDGQPSHAGRRIILPRATAEAAARNGAVEIVETPAMSIVAAGASEPIPTSGV